MSGTETARFTVQRGPRRGGLTTMTIRGAINPWRESDSIREGAVSGAVSSDQVLQTSGESRAPTLVLPMKHDSLLVYGMSPEPNGVQGAAGSNPAVPTW